MYDLIGYGDMVADRVRTDAYARALRSVVTPASAVLDLGSGTGLFALLACRFGARHVYAVEPADAIALAREIARANGLEDRITFIQQPSERVTLPETVDVIVSDVRGVLPLYQRSVALIVDARRRLLAPGGTVIPGRDDLMVALVEAPDLHAKHVRPWTTPIHDVDGSVAAAYALNTWHRARVRPEQLLTRPECWGRLEYTTLESSGLRGEVTWSGERAGTAHGLSVWFESELAPGIGYSNGPDAPELIYGSAFFPLSEPVDLAAGDRIRVALRADAVGDDYTWSWDTTIRASGNGDTVKAKLRQSTFFSLPMLPERLARRAASHRPRLSDEGELALFILQAMGEGRTLEDIARQICTRFPGRFPDWRAALDHVCAFSDEYGESSADGVTSLPAGARRKSAHE